MFHFSKKTNRLWLRVAVAAVFIGLLLGFNYLNVLIKPMYTGPEDIREQMFYLPILCALISGVTLFIAWIRGSQLCRVTMFALPFTGLVFLSSLELSYSLFPIMYSLLPVKNFAALGFTAVFLLFAPGLAQIIYILKPNFKIAIVSPIALFLLVVLVRAISNAYISETVEVLGSVPPEFYW